MSSPIDMISIYSPGLCRARKNLESALNEFRQGDKYCPVDLGFDISKLDIETLQKNIQASDATPSGFHTVCEYASGRRTQSYTAMMGLGALKTWSTIWTAMEPQLGSFTCRVFLFSETGRAEQPRMDHLEGSILVDPMHPWPEGDIHKILLWKPSTC